MYYSGLGVSKSRQKAKELYRQAADSDKNAKLLLEEVELEEQKEQQEHQNQGNTSEDHIKSWASVTTCVTKIISQLKYKKSKNGFVGVGWLAPHSKLALSQI